MKKTKQFLFKYRIASIARIATCVLFAALAVIGISSLVRAMSLEDIANDHGVPAVWDIASLGNPDEITVPVTFWDQRQDSCDDPNRQFEWVICGYWTKGVIQGIVKPQLGSDGLPVPAYTNSTDAWNANRDVFTANVTGNDPVQPTDNFYRWFHEVSGLSKQIDGRTITFTRIGENTYTYGRDGIFPLDDVDFSKDDEASSQIVNGETHNYHFTSYMSIPMKISTSGDETFEFSGDDDVWVFLNGQLILDIGGLHEQIHGKFVINKDGSITTIVQHVNDTSGRAVLGEPSNDFNSYVNPLNIHNESTWQDTVTKTIDAGLREGEVVNLDFFYAERSTVESNTHITISNMNWPISADSEVTAKVVGKSETSTGNLVQFNTSVTNSDPSAPLNIERMAAYIYETTAAGFKQSGFLPLDNTTLEYTFTPNDESSWQHIEISAPSNDDSGFNFTSPIALDPNGGTKDTVYFRYFGETASDTGSVTSLVSYYTTLNDATGFTYDYDTVSYAPTEIPTPIPDPTLTINYVYSDGTTAADSYISEIPAGNTYTVDSPEITGHTPDRDVVTGIMPETNVTITVIYTPNLPEKPDVKNYNLTIHYVYEDGTTAAPDYSNSISEGDTYNVSSPEIDEYIPDQSIVAGTMPGNDLEITVVYTPNGTPFNLTIHYVYEDGTTAAPDHNDTIPAGKPYQVASPEIEKYAPDQTIVAGTMPKHDIEITVIYTTKLDNPDINIPTTPNEPTNPSVPTEPTIPPSDNFDDDLFYTPPLGDVAFVPNTGIVSDVIAPLFNQHFADAVLSQGVVMTVLLLFATSFATYFSMRKYLKGQLTPATISNTTKSRTATTRSSKNASKSVKSAKRTLKTDPSCSTVKRSSSQRTAKKK